MLDITAKMTLNFRLKTARNNCYESLPRKKVLIFKAISGAKNAFRGSKLKFPFVCLCPLSSTFVSCSIMWGLVQWPKFLPEYVK